MPTLIACRHSPTYRKTGFKSPLQPPNGDTPTAKIHSFSLSGKFFWLKSASRKGNGRSPKPFCPTMGQKTQRAAQAIAPHCTRHRTALHQPSHRTAPQTAGLGAGTGRAAGRTDCHIATLHRTEQKGRPDSTAESGLAVSAMRWDAYHTSSGLLGLSYTSLGHHSI